MLPVCSTDLWETLQQSNKTVVLYGMGNGADKILDACAQKGVTVSGVFASDGFARGNLFHGMPVRTWAQTKAEYGIQNLIVLLSFGTSRPDVLETIGRIDAETELYAPDVPVFGNGLFDRAFLEAHKTELEEARALLSDDESRRIFDNVLQYKLTGRLCYLKNAESDPDKVWESILHPRQITRAADLGAYNGDTVRELIERSGGAVQKIYALEPDARNFRKLCAYAESEGRAEVIPCPIGAWSEKTTLYFDKSGNRNASFEVNRSQSLDARPAKCTAVEADTLDHVLGGHAVDYIKYDVEGSEKEALLGSVQTVARFAPKLLVSLYHRNEDLFALPLLLHKLFPEYRGYYLRRFRGIPAWDLNLYLTKD
ncbi:MAG: FkbM family methyltransferase [Clostridia bacterium]|nr:FkbM family methyltransferase [Clostridia bacterium]